MLLPETGLPADQIRHHWQAYAADDLDWRAGRGWALVYDSPPWHSSLVDEAAARFAHENALSSSAFPSAGRWESEVIAMAASVVAPDSAAQGRAHGVFTSGGTESLMVAVKAYRDATGRGEIVLPTTAHPGLWKAADYLGLRLQLVPVDAAGLPDPDELIAKVGPDTALIALSAPCFPYGAVDPIQTIAVAAAERGVGVHVDAAMGGMFLPFLPPEESVPFGLDVPGVTSVSVDLHKYGYGAKGASVLLFGSTELRRASYYVSTRWPGGAYAASGVLGTRPVGASAAAWTAMIALGRQGYRDLVTQVIGTAHRLQSGLCELGLQVIGSPPTGVFAMTSPRTPIPRLAGGLGERGWWIDTQAEPPSLHFVTFPRHTAIADRFLADAAAVVRGEASEAPQAEGPDGVSASYGVMVRGGQELTDDLLRDHLDWRFDGGQE